MTDSDLRLALQRLISQWREKAAVTDSFHATMGIGWKVCADELEALLGRAETTQCPHGENCACAISTRHEWFVAFCNERDKVGRAETTEPHVHESPVSACDSRETSKNANDSPRTLQASREAIPSPSPSEP